MQQGVQTDEICKIQQAMLELFANNVATVYTGLKTLVESVRYPGIHLRAKLSWNLYKVRPHLYDWRKRKPKNPSKFVK